MGIRGDGFVGLMLKRRATVATKDSGKESRGQQRPAKTPPERASREAPVRRRAQRPAGQTGATETPPAAPTGAAPRTRRKPAEAESAPAELARELEAERELARGVPEAVLGDSQPPLEPPEAQREPEPAGAPNPVREHAMLAEEQPYAASMPPPEHARRRERQRSPHGNALGILIERHFTNPTSPCRSYSDLERRSGISREALSRYVTARPDRRRSPTIDTLVGIADAMHLSLEAVSRAAAASVRGVIPPREEEQRAREEVLCTLVVGLTDAQFNAVVELLRQLRPVSPAAR